MTEALIKNLGVKDGKKNWRTLLLTAILFKPIYPILFRIFVSSSLNGLFD